MRHRLIRAGIAASLFLALAFSSAPGAFATGGFDLTLSLSGPTRIKSTGTYTYTITVQNLGPETATNLHVSGGGGDWFNPVSVQCPGSSNVAGCDLADLAPGATVTATYTLNVCCLVRHEMRHAWLDAMVGPSDGAWDAWSDPNLENNYAVFDVFIIGKQIH
jgi:hypothetical protein